MPDVSEADERLRFFIANITRADAGVVIALTQPLADAPREAFGVVSAAYRDNASDS